MPVTISEIASVTTNGISLVSRANPPSNNASVIIRHHTQSFPFRSLGDQSICRLDLPPETLQLGDLRIWQFYDHLCNIKCTVN